jgi:hypothetical protein
MAYGAKEVDFRGHFNLICISNLEPTGFKMKLWRYVVWYERYSNLRDTT